MEEQLQTKVKVPRCSKNHIEEFYENEYKHILKELIKKIDDKISESESQRKILLKNL